MKRRSLVPLLAILLFTCHSATAQDYTRLGLGGATILDGIRNANGVTARGEDHFPEGLDGIVAGGYALIPYSFAPRDFNVSSVEEITSLQFEVARQFNDADGGDAIEVFFVPDSREDLGFNYTEETESCDWGHSGGDFGNDWPARCYTPTYDPNQPGGISPGDYSSAPVSLGVFDMDIFADVTVIDLPVAGVGASLAAQINADEEFHLLIAAPSDDTFVRLVDTPFADSTRPILTVGATGPAAAGVTKDVARQFAVHASDADIFDPDFYGSGNDDNFSEYGIGSWEYTKDDFGVTDDITEVGSVQLVLAHNDRSFSDGSEVEFFYVSDTAEELGFVDDEFEPIPYQLTYNSELENGIDADQYNDAPISLGTYPYEPKLGSRREVFDLNLPQEVRELMAEAINNEEDFQIIIAAPEPTSDITFSGLEGRFDPGVPQLTINLEADPVDEFSLDTNGDGEINAGDAALLCSAVEEAGVSLVEELAAGGFLPGDFDLNGAVEFPDFLTLSGNFNQEADYGGGDVDCNGVVEFPDFLTMSGNFGQAVATASVPEPSSIIYTLPLLLLGVVRRRNR